MRFRLLPLALMLSAVIGLAVGLAVLAPAYAAKNAKPAAKEKSDSKAKDDSADDGIGQETSLNNLKDAPPAPQLACTGAFGKDSSHAKLATEFGAKNVEWKDVEDGAGVRSKATVVFDADPTKRLVVTWRDLKGRTQPSTIRVEAPAIWQGPGGVRNGLPIKDFEKLNGGKFSMVAFGGVNSGVVSGVKGAFAEPPGGCALEIRFEPGIANPLPPRFAAVTGEQTLQSNNLVLRRTRPQIGVWTLAYK